VGIALLNTSIVTEDGVYSMRTVTADEAEVIVVGEDVVSYVGHPATAQVMHTLLGVDVPVSRNLYAQQPGETALVFKLNGRPEPGRELSREELEEIGFTFKVLYRIS